MDITIHCDESTRPLEHFWRSTGFTPAEWLLRDDMKQTLAFVGSLPWGAVRFVRIHYLLDLVEAEGLGTPGPRYDWSRLDEGLDVLVRNRLAPFFELMGNPSGRFSDFNDGGQRRAWRGLVRDLAVHLMERYGREEVESWFFETWNEPDCRVWWWQFADDPASFCNYYDACSEGLREASPKLRFGGPGTCIDLSATFRAIMEHCDRGTNSVTGETGVRMDFLSVHVKGAPATPADVNPDSASICDRERQIIEYVRRHHRRLADLPFLNDECDPQTGWDDVHTWRGRSYYAALAAKIIHQHILRISDALGVRYELLGNDNGFLGAWGHRTHLARFGTADGIERGEFALVKKPVLNVMGLLAMLGDTRCATDGASDPAADVGAIATRRGNEQVAALVYHSRDRIISSGTERVRLRLEGLPFDRAMLAHWRIDEAHGDPFAVWESMGAPRTPSPEQIEAMRRRQEPCLLSEPREVSTEGGAVTVEFELPLPAVSLVLLSARPDAAPPVITGLRAEPYRGIDGGGETLLLWDGSTSRAVRTYEVLAADSLAGPFRRVNEDDLLAAAFLVPRSRIAAKCFQVRAVDYWARPSAPSAVLDLR